MNDEIAILNEEQEEQNLENGGMSLLDLQGSVGALIENAIEYIDQDISPNRAEATRYFLGEPFGNEEDGRSSVVDMTVRDTVGKIMPSLLRVFFGTEKVVEFVPTSSEDVAYATQATDYVNHILTKDNNLFMELQSCWQDALVRKVGILKYFWEENPDPEAYTITVDQTGLIALQSDPELEISIIKEYVESNQMMGMEMGLNVMTSGPSYSVHVTYKKEGRVRVKSLPCEEFLINEQATSIEDAMITAHRRMATVSELVKMGYDREFVESKAGGSDLLRFNVERRERENNQLDFSLRTDESQNLVEYVEAYVKVDWDNDGISELRKICCMGTDHEIVHNEAWDKPPFATFCPCPQSHVFFGQSIYDLVGDIQKIKSNVLRNSLDSLSLSIHPRVAVVEGQANIDDVTNTEVGAIIRQSQPGAVTPFNLPFVGKEAFPMLGYLDTLKENRTGISKASMGLDAESLQSTTQMAVNATLKGAQAQIEMIARIFAETGMRELFSGVLKLVIQHQQDERIVRLRNAFTPIDPRPWNANMDVSVDVALGASSEQEKIDSLSAIITKQEEIMNKFGPNNPLVSLEQYRNALSAQINMAGFKNTSGFINEGPVQLPEPPPPKPTPEELLADVQRQDIEADMQKKAAELSLKQQQMIRDDDFRQDKLEADIMLDVAELKAKYPMIRLTQAELFRVLRAEREQTLQ